jgi:hypothetical protein
MKYKGIQYQILQTASPQGFKWTVQFGDGSTKMGHTLTRDGAIFAARYTIDNAAKETKTK